MESIRIWRVSQAGVGHEDVITGDRIVSAPPDGATVIRVYNGDKVAEVHTFTGVFRTLWRPASAVAADGGTEEAR